MEATIEFADIPARFRACAARYGEAPALYDDSGVLDYGELDRLSDAMAGALVGAGLRPGARAALLCANGREFVIAYLAILKAGATVVPINLLSSAQEVAYILADAAPVLLLHQPAFAAVAEAACACCAGAPIRIELAADRPDFAALLAHPPLAPRSGAEVAAVLYTSGTTGRPKGAMLSHANLIANAEGSWQGFELVPGDRLLVVLPLFHSFAATTAMLTPLLHGLAMIPVARFEPRLVTQAIARHGATVFLGVPSMYGVLLRHAEVLVEHWRGVRLCISGGAALPVALLREFEARFEVILLEGAGATECSPVFCVNRPSLPRKPGSIGPALPGVELCVRDPAGQVLPRGETGELCVRGPNVMHGYLGLPEASREAFYDDWFRTGDLARIDADGHVYLVDRIKDLVITNGMNVYPRVVEEALYAHPAIAEVAVVGDPDPKHGEVVVAHVSLVAGAEVSTAALRAWCRDRLGAHEVPRRLVQHDALPKNASGKILKRALRRYGVETAADGPPEGGASV
ncbi:long-chain-fatty-acid--CoA ligase [Marichromatium bheemlicum]|uniref:Long-chain fatty acid--CoA ligase n=1 Tax=Marichromatium bheemlicum TaxID=365339 RepID=A0ABX1I3V0_9GAMM|nr:long-chain fatty acid--CoA ligase [Marichromatium bheemlicum]NKN32218.1 long-chain fatty acid--CoA ligase [Marichromatium bheemlicum]